MFFRADVQEGHFVVGRYVRIQNVDGAHPAYDVFGLALNVELFGRAFSFGFFNHKLSFLVLCPSELQGECLIVILSSSAIHLSPLWGY